VEIDKTDIPFTISDSTKRLIAASQGAFFKSIVNLSPEKIAADLVNPIKAIRNADILKPYTTMEKKKVLEVGAGLGMNLIVWSRLFNMDVFGIEPEELGFVASNSIIHDLFKQNKLDPSRILPAIGEKIPFKENTFDLVFSSNVLEHTTDPEMVIDESLRVLRPNGIMQMVFPNYHSFFDGHYAVFHPPILNKNFFPWYVKTIWGKNPEFAYTLRTELNVLWTEAIIKKLQKKYKLDILSLGQNVFFDRMKTIDFEAWAGLTKVKTMVKILKKIGINSLIAYIILQTKTWTPIILTVRKK
jgi:SAM-dependent methyltransferase